jgi:hypothetical protein
MNGIDVHNFKTSPVTCNRNIISLVTASNSFVKYGIKAYKNSNNAAFAQVTGNRVNSNGYNYPSMSSISSTISNMIGIYCSEMGNSSTHADLSCNTVADINQGFYFDGTSYLDWKKNIMERNKYGMVLSSTANIGLQSGSCNPSDNEWLNGTAATGGWPGWPTSGASIYHTYSFSSSTASSAIYYRGSVATTKPLNNGGSGAYTSTTLLDVESGSVCSTPSSIPAYNTTLCAPAYLRPTPDEVLASTGNNQSYTLFPNPTTGNITINQREVADGTVAARVMNIVGASIYEGNLEFSGGQSQLNLPDVAPGVYVLELKDAGGQRFTSKVIVQK